MHRRSRTVLAFLGIVAASHALAASVFDGTWKADLDKNQQNAKPDVRELSNGIYKCLSCDPPYEIKADGSDQPASSQGLDARSVRIVDEHSIEITGKNKGRAAFKATVMTSADGKSQIIRETIFNMGPQPFTVTEHFTRVGAGSNGAHAVSGTWKLVRTEGSDNVDVTTFTITGRTVARRDAQGSSYVAQIDGPAAALVGDSRWDHVAVKMPDPRTLEETMSKDGQVRMSARWSINVDGVTMHARFEDAKGEVFEQSGHKVK
ncbi:MAG TPA: hypothetical protein VGL55_02565 [Steroidobacteraceae bacterium]